MNDYDKNNNNNDKNNNDMTQMLPPYRFGHDAIEHEGSQRPTYPSYEIEEPEESNTTRYIPRYNPQDGSYNTQDGSYNTQVNPAVGSFHSGEIRAPHNDDPFSRAARRKGHIIAFITIVVGIIVGVGVIFWDSKGSAPTTGNGFTFDSGVGACRQIAENAAKGTDDTNSDAKMTKKELAEKESPFKMSKYTDLKVAGVNVMETVYAMDQLSEDDIGPALADLTQLEAQWTALQTACGAHDVTIPSLRF